MLDDLMRNLFPNGGDLVAVMTEIVLWIGALFFLACAILIGMIGFAARRIKPVPVRAGLNSPAAPRAANHAR
jgi:hypothetical protein